MSCNDDMDTFKMRASFWKLAAVLAAYGKLSKSQVREFVQLDRTAPPTVGAVEMLKKLTDELNATLPPNERFMVVDMRAYWKRIMELVAP